MNKIARPTFGIVVCSTTDGGFRVPEGSHGSATVEYLVLVSLCVVALLAGPDVFSEVIAAVRQVYEGFTYALAWTFQVPSI